MFFKKAEQTSNKTIIANFSRFIKLLPNKFGSLHIGNSTAQQSLEEILKKFQGNDEKPAALNDLLRDLGTFLAKFPPPQENENVHFFALMISGFIYAVIKDNQSEELVAEIESETLQGCFNEARQLLENEPNSTALLYQALRLGVNMARYNGTVPSFIKEKEQYLELLAHFRPSIDYIGLNPFEQRVMDFKATNPYQTFDEMVNNLDITQLPKADHTPNNHKIHLIWMGGTPKQYFDNIKSWKEKNANYEVVLYIDSAMEKSILNKENPEFRDWCQSNKIKLVNIDKAISSHPAYKYFVYEHSVPNYGAASDIARYILLRLYGGLYFDVPDIICKTELPELKQDILCHSDNNNVNNDCLAVVTEEGQTVFETALTTISEQYQTGYFGFGKQHTSNLGNAWLANHIQRKISKTLALTGIKNIPDHTSPELDQLVKSIQTDLASSWVNLPEKSQNKEVKTNNITLITDAITDILISLRFEPRVLDFDKYPIFSDIENLKIALGFLLTHFKENLVNVLHVAAYLTKDADEAIKLINQDNFPKLYQPLIQVACKALVDQTEKEAQKHFVFTLIKTNKENKESTDRHGNTPFLAACRNMNYELAEFLLTQDVNFRAKNYNGENALNLIACIENDVKNKDNHKIKKLMDSGTKLIKQIFEHDCTLLMNITAYESCINQAIQNQNYDFAMLFINLMNENFNKLFNEENCMQMHECLQSALIKIESTDGIPLEEVESLTTGLIALIEKTKKLPPLIITEDQKDDEYSESPLSSSPRFDFSNKTRTKPEVDTHISSKDKKLM